MLPTPSLREALSVHFEELLVESTGFLTLDATVSSEVSAAVTHYLLDQALRPPLPDDYLHLLIYRALRCLHQDPAAQAWAAERLPNHRDSLPVFDPSIWPGPVPLIVWQLFASRLVRPARTVTAEGRILWTLDFRRLKREQAGWMEISLLPGLHALLTQLAPAWDETGGRGLLGLRGLYAAGFAPTPRRRKKSAVRSAYAPLDAPAIHAYCRRVLSNLQTARGWPHTPDVLYLDLHAEKRKR
ncbi:MAG: hypothetical protein LBN38_04505 [Verrucomicrobiota bacterium]|jgi:hypothetical protein|nr:hypothetical protein [Verrucomicrobiota bacterium]